MKDLLFSVNCIATSKVFEYEYLPAEYQSSEYKLLCQMIPELILDCGSHVGVLHPQWGKEPDGVVDDLDPTEDGEASEETHRSPNETKLGLQGHLLVLFHFVIGWCVKENLNKVDLIFFRWGWKMDRRKWEEKNI